MEKLDQPRIRVDFNEMVEDNLVLLSTEDKALDSAGNSVELAEGREVNVYEEDSDDRGNPDFLVATGLVERNRAQDWSSHVRWCCRINADGVRHLSEIRTSA